MGVVTMGWNATARPERLAVIAVSALLALALACQSSQGGAGPKDRQIEQVPWDAEQVTSLTAQLATQMTAVRQSVRLEPGIGDLLRMQASNAVRLTDLLRILERSTKQLAVRVADGGGLDETTGLIKKIGSQLRSARVHARSLMLTEPTLEVVEQARETLEALSPYYGTRLNPADPPAEDAA